MNSDYWNNKWRTNEIAFHRDQFHPKLIQYFPVRGTGKVLVPLCGKSLDMMWLSSVGYEVVGVELSPVACTAFFEENQIPFTIEFRGDFQVFMGNHVQIWCGDFFMLPEEAWQDVDLIYDRAALVALPEDLRRQYVQKICMMAQNRSQKEQSFEIFLISIESSHPEMKGPPFSINFEEIKRLFGSTFTINQLKIENDDKHFKDHPKLKDFEIAETTYLLQKSF